MTGSRLDYALSREAPVAAEAVAVAVESNESSGVNLAAAVSVATAPKQTVAEWPAATVRPPEAAATNLATRRRLPVMTAATSTWHHCSETRLSATTWQLPIRCQLNHASTRHTRPSARIVRRLTRSSRRQQLPHLRQHTRQKILMQTVAATTMKTTFTSWRLAKISSSVEHLTVGPKWNKHPGTDRDKDALTYDNF
jgi:hypothetical protein